MHVTICGVCSERKLEVRVFSVGNVRVVLGRCHDCDVRHCHYGQSNATPSGCSAKVPNPALDARCTAGHIPV